jgi:DNA-binding NtrC family response regulator
MPPPKPTVLVVDRDNAPTRALVAFLRARDLDVIWTRDTEGALGAIEDRVVECVVADSDGPRIDGMTILRRARAIHAGVCAVIVSEAPAVERAVEAMREGAYDFQTKPIHHEKLLAVLQRGIRDQRLAARIEEMEGRLDERFGLGRLTGGSPSIAMVMEQVSHVAPTHAAVLIEGEKGTGKGLLARVIHQNSPRKNERFVWVNCGALAAGVIEGELFGLERDEDALHGGPRRGRLEMAAGGTLFLDEVAALPGPVQLRLLRAIRERAFERVGGSQTLRADMRLVAATHHDLEAEVAAGRFRDDLFQRLGVARIRMPALRERRDDIPLLVDEFIRELNRRHGRRVSGVTRGALERLEMHDWPGNLRELKVVLEGMIVFADGRRPLELSDLPAALAGRAGTRGPDVAVGMTLAEAERKLITQTLAYTGRDKPRAAALLAIGLRTLYRKIEAYGLDERPQGAGSGTRGRSGAGRGTAVRKKGAAGRPSGAKGGTKRRSTRRS